MTGWFLVVLVLGFAPSWPPDEIMPYARVALPFESGEECRAFLEAHQPEFDAIGLIQVLAVSCWGNPPAFAASEGGQ